jgi:hypothetical protein
MNGSYEVEVVFVNLDFVRRSLSGSQLCHLLVALL